MKNLLYICVAASSLFLMSCEDFLDTKNLTKKDTSNYPQTVTDAQQMITGIYSNLNYAVASPASSSYFVSELVADDRFGGGGENDKMVQALDLMLNYGSSMLQDFWNTRYKGIFRANMAIATLDNCTGYESDDQKNQIKGEAYFMRAFFYSEMATLFGQVPLVVTTDPVNLPKATPDELYAQIASDLKTAIEMMPAKPYSSVEAGHATKWTAEALMARVYLFYTGFYAKDALPLVGGGTITKAQVVTWLEDCIKNSGHTLVGDFRNLWAYTNKYTVEDYSYTKGKGLKWVEDDGAVNPETLFSIKFSNFPSWSTTIGYSNQNALYFGIRGGQDLGKTFPFGQGWGMGPVNPTLWNDWKTAEPNDIRREASIVDIPKELPNYGKGGWSDFVQETDFWQKKYSPVSAKNPAGGYASSYSVLMYNTAENFQLDNTMDQVIIRLADVYLMHSELTGTVTYMNKVRERAKLAPKAAYSLADLQNERRWELAFEGTRWNDIRRWGIAADLLEKQIGIPCYFKATSDVTKAFGGGYKARYNATKGFFPIPEAQIALSEGVLKQNDGWGTTAQEYTGWK